VTTPLLSTPAGRARRRRGLGGGLLLAALYAVVVLATGLTAGHPVRPLFDGIGTSLPYKWVKPPWYVGSTNIKPEPSHTEIAFEDGTSPLIGVNSGDAQVILNLPRGALPAHEGDSAVRVSFTPLDPKKLAKPPAPVRPDGNAYRVDMTYQPSGQVVRQTTTSGNVIMVVPDEAQKMLFSLDGKSWDELPTHMLGDPNTVGSAFNKPGYYLVGTALPEFANPNKGKGTKRTVGTVLVVVALAVLLGYVLPTILRRSRAAQATGNGPAAGAGRAPTRTVRRRKR
jgi:hypothetical protein